MLEIATLKMTKKWSWQWGAVYHLLIYFYFTYEELKQEELVYHPFVSIIIFTLPMRNWNNVFVLLICQDIDIFTLPMRNWNSRWILKGFFMSSVFLLYLWGIETSSLCHRRHIPEFLIFTLPMRNWNLFSSSHTSKKKAIFTLPMRNWNP